MSPRFPRFAIACFLVNALTAAGDFAAEKADYASASPVAPSSGLWRHEELRRFPAREANQGVASDDQFLYVISNSAIGKYRKDTFERVLSVNLTGAFLGIRCVAPIMKTKGGGSIVNVSSNAGLAGGNGFGAYASSKFGLRGLTKVAAFEL